MRRTSCEVLSIGHWSDRTIRRKNFVGTHDLCVRCIKGYGVVVLTGTDAQIVRPYKGLLVSCVLYFATRLAVRQRYTFR